jgi:hypothetical protein
VGANIFGKIDKVTPFCRDLIMMLIYVWVSLVNFQATLKMFGEKFYLSLPKI